MFNKIRDLFSTINKNRAFLDWSILVIDDNAMDREFAEKVLWKQNYKVLKAEDGETGIEIAKKQRPDLIILDCLLPNIRGEEVCKILKNDERTKGIPIVIWTVLKNNLLRCYDVGVTKYLIKPVSAKILLSEIKDALNNPAPILDEQDDSYQETTEY